MTLLSQKLAKLLLPQVFPSPLASSLQDVLPTVARGRLYTACFVTPFRLRNDVTICNISEVISISGAVAMLSLTV